MSIWGKIFGGTGGFVIGGPIGGLLGVFAGHAIDKFTSKKLPESIAVKQVNFTIGVIALSAKMAKADGIVSSHELDAFKKGLIINQNELNNVEKSGILQNNQFMVLRAMQDNLQNYLNQFFYT